MNKRLQKSRLDHQQWLKERGLTLSQIKAKKVIDYSWEKCYTSYINVETKTKEELLKKFYPVYKTDIMTNLHKENKQTQKEILFKASRVMPLFNKGGLQYASPTEDMKTVGSLSRRG